jgi:hypothetical protein
MICNKSGVWTDRAESQNSGGIELSEVFFPITLAINDVRLLCHGSENYISPKEMETQRRLRDGSISDTF